MGELQEELHNVKEHVCVLWCLCHSKKQFIEHLSIIVLVLIPLFILLLQLELKSKEIQGLMEQRDQVVAHLQQYCAGYQALASEREQLHQQYLQQSQLMDQLQHDESYGRVQLELSHNQLKEAQVCVSHDY